MIVIWREQCLFANVCLIDGKVNKITGSVQTVYGLLPHCSEHWLSCTNTKPVFGGVFITMLNSYDEK